MSSYGHHTTSSSFPSDYALLAAARGTTIADDDVLNDSFDDPPRSNRPINPSMAAVRRKNSAMSLVHERTPLLPSSVPRIHEEVRPTDHYDSSGLSTRSAVYFEELRILSKYTLPVFGTHVLEYSLVVVGTISIGHLSTNALAAATLATMTASVSGFSIVQGFASALDTLLPSAWTSSQPNLVGLWCLRISVLMFAMLFPIFAVWFNSESILLALKQDPEVAHLAAVYLKWLSIGLPAYVINNVSRRYFQSQGLFAVPTRIIMVIAPINAVLNYLLVWGPEPFRLGFIGAPLASAISFNLMAICSIIYGAFFVPKTAWHPITARMFTKLGILMRLGLGGVGQVGSEWWSWELVGLAASLLGPVALASQSVLLVSASTTFQAPFALSIAAAVRIGNLLGESNAKRADIATKTALFMALVIALVWSTMFLVFRNSWARIFNDDPEVIELVGGVLPLVALFQVFDGLSAVVSGVLRSQGRQTTGALLNISAYYVIGIPSGIYLAFKAGLELWGLWIGLTISLIYSALVGGYICLKADWNYEVKKVLERIEADKHQDQSGDVNP